MSNPTLDISRAAFAASDACRLCRSCAVHRLAHEHCLACNGSCPKQLVCTFGISKRKSLRDDRCDLSLLEKLEQSAQAFTIALIYVDLGDKDQ
jgi:hypothetical protein